MANREIVIRFDVSSQNLPSKVGPGPFGGAAMRSGYSVCDAHYCAFGTVSLSALVKAVQLCATPWLSLLCSSINIKIQENGSAAA